jgi:predicted transport protein
MKEITSCIEQLRLKLERHKKEDLKEIPTRTIFIDPMLEALGWDVRDPDDVQLEFPTIDGKSVDFAPKINGKPVLLIEAKALNDPLTNVKDITQVVGYATNAGVEWCILTNGVTYKVYKTSEKAEAPDKLLFEVSIDPKESEGKSTQQIADQFARFSKDAMARGVLDEIGEQVFTRGKIRKALDRLFADPPLTLVRLVRSSLGDESIRPAQVKEIIPKLWTQSPEIEIPSTPAAGSAAIKSQAKPARGRDYGEGHHLKGKPREVLELFETIDKFCKELSPLTVQRRYLAKYVSYSDRETIFCCVHLLKSGLRVWLKLVYSDLQNPPEYVRDVSNVGHWGTGDVEIGIDNLEKLEVAKSLIKQSFEKSKSS